MDQPGKVANPVRGQLDEQGKCHIFLSSSAPENLVSRDGFGRPVSRQPAHSFSMLRLSNILSWCPHTWQSMSSVQFFVGTSLMTDGPQNPTYNILLQRCHPPRVVAKDLSIFPPVLARDFFVAIKVLVVLPSITLVLQKQKILSKKLLKKPINNKKVHHEI